MEGIALSKNLKNKELINNKFKKKQKKLNYQELNMI